jgi:hypothetical protein
MINNFAASGTGSDHNGAAPAPGDRGTTMDDATAIDADVAGAAGRVVRHPVVDSSESAKPTGTTNAATSAASNTTRNRFRRIPRMFASPLPGIVRVRGARQVVRSLTPDETSSDVPRACRDARDAGRRREAADLAAKPTVVPASSAVRVEDGAERVFTC